MSDDGYHEIVALRAELARVITERDAAREVIERARHSVSCYEHADNCCVSWCAKCKEQTAFRADMARAL